MNESLSSNAPTKPPVFNNRVGAFHLLAQVASGQMGMTLSINTAPLIAS